MNAWLIAVLAVLLGHYVLDVVAEVLNARHASPTLPDEFAGTYDADRYRRSQEYLADTTRLHLAGATAATAVVVALLLGGGFDAADALVRRAGQGPIVTGLLYIGLLGYAAQLLQLPFDAYRTFVLETRYAFNRTTVRTFVLDALKSWLLLAVIGGPVLALALWLFGAAGPFAWLGVWAAVSLCQVALVFLAPAVILPLFNTFTPLEEGALRHAVEDYARRQRYRMRGVFAMDGSRRSTKSNAFFTGFGRYRRLVLLDTLLERHPPEEVLAVVAHEMGHHARHHVRRGLLVSTLFGGVLLGVLSLIVHSTALPAALGMRQPSLHANLVFFGLLAAPLVTVLSLAGNALSRRREYEADAYAAATGGGPEPLIAALKRLSRDSLVNLTPHPLKVVLSYSHPPMLDRIRALRLY